MTNIKNIKYWEMREARNMYKDMQLAEDCAKELSVIYSKAAIYTAKQIEGIFNRFASKHHLKRTRLLIFFQRLTAEISKNCLKHTRIRQAPKKERC